MPDDTKAKASVARLQRLAPMLDHRLEDAAHAFELLVSEAQGGALHPDLWEKLHAAAVRDDRVEPLVAAYLQLAQGKRLRSLPAEAQAGILMHGAELVQGVLGNGDLAAKLYESLLDVVPDHAEAFTRLE